MYQEISITMSTACQKNKSVLFDSNVWIGLFLQNDSLHRSASRLFDKYTDREIIVSEYVLLEVVTIIKQHAGYKEAQLVMERLQSSENCRVLPSRFYFTETTRLFSSLQEKHLSFVDVSLVMLSKDFEVVTLDTKLVKAIDARG